MSISSENQYHAEDEKQRRLELSDEQRHSVETFNKMMKESQAKWNNLNDKFMHMVNKPRPKYECCQCGDEVKDYDIAITMKKSNGYEVVEHPMCNVCANQMAREMGADYRQEGKLND